MVCENNSTCTTFENSKTGLLESYCHCKKGWTGELCGDDLDECENTVKMVKNKVVSYGKILTKTSIFSKFSSFLFFMPCSGTCINTPGSYRCECPVNYDLASDGHSCFQIQIQTAVRQPSN